MSNITYILIAIIALALVALVLAWRRKKAQKPMSKMGAFSLFLVIAGIVFGGDNKVLGYGLISLGLILALADIFIKGRVNKNYLAEFNEDRKIEREQNKQKILDILQEKREINNNDVEKLLSVADATATRYLEELEKEGRIKQVGKTGQSVFYKKS